jgi:hypothetical protein
MSKDEALDLALEALDAWLPTWPNLIEKQKAAITAIKQARALDKMAENARELGLDYEPVGLIDRLTNPEQHYAFTDSKKANAVLMSLCQEAADALAAPVQEPWGFHIQFNNGKDATFKGFEHLAGCEAHLESGETITMIYTTPPAAQRQWVGLTDGEVEECVKCCRSADGLARAIEAKLKEKNT